MLFESCLRLLFESQSRVSTHDHKLLIAKIKWKEISTNSNTDAKWKSCC